MCKCHPLVDLANAVLLYELLKFQDNLDMVSQKVSSLLEIRAEVSGLCVWYTKDRKTATTQH